MNIGLIPARGGSKTIPGKNIKLLNGKPLIAYTIEAALKSKLLDRVFVSTDDEQIKKVAQGYGAEVPFLRPKELSDDHTGDLPVVSHTLMWLQDNLKIKVSKVVYLRPTTPFKTGKIIDECLLKSTQGQFTGLRSVTMVEGVHHPYWMYKTDNNLLKPFTEGESPEKYYQRQLLPECFRLNGVVDIMYADTVKNNSLYGDKIGFHDVNKIHSIDIDDYFDWDLAEFILLKYFNSKEDIDE